MVHGQFSGGLQPVWARASFAQPFSMIPGGSPDQGSPHDTLVVIAVTGINIDPCCLQGYRPDLVLSRAWVGALPWPQVVGQATHIWLLFSILMSPGLFFFMTLKLFPFSISLISPPNTCI